MTGDGRIDPRAITPGQAAKILSAASGVTVLPETIQRHIDRGAPVDPDGKIGLVHYAAWLVRETAQVGN